MSLHYKTKITGKNKKFNQDEQHLPNNRQKVFFACAPNDFDLLFDSITDEILSKQPGCAVYFLYPGEEIDKESMELFLSDMVLFVIPVTINVMRDDCFIQAYLDYALKNQIRLLLIQCESGIEALFNDRYGSYQLLNRVDTDSTAVSYDEKLTQFLDTAIINDELAEQIRQAFDAYIFLSYRKKDRKYANELMRLIHSNDFCRDIAIWYDEYLVSGENFNDAIMAAMEKSGLFALLVTPNLINEENYVHSVEYPEAIKANKPVFPAEAEKTDMAKLQEMYDCITETVRMTERGFADELRKAIEKIALKENDKDPKHNYLIGLAYLNGIDVEVNRDLAVELILGAAEAGLKEAMDKIYSLSVDLKNQMKYPEALKLAEKLKVIYEALDEIPDVDKADLALLLGELYKETNSLTYSEDSLLVAVSIYESVVSEDDDSINIRLLDIYCSLAEVYILIAQKDKTEEYCKKALKIAKKLSPYIAYNSDGSGVYKQIGVIADLYVLIGNYEMAEKLFKISLKINSVMDSNGSYNTNCLYKALIASDLGLLYTEKMKKPTEAERLYFESLKTLKAMEESAQIRDFYISQLYQRFARFYSLSLSSKKTKQCYSKALQLLKELAKKYSKQTYKPYISMLYINLSMFYRSRLRFIKSKFYRALAFFISLKYMYRSNVSEDVVGTIIFGCDTSNKSLIHLGVSNISDMPWDNMRGNLLSRAFYTPIFFAYVLINKPDD